MRHAREVLVRHELSGMSGTTPRKRDVPRAMKPRRASRRDRMSADWVKNADCRSGYRFLSSWPYMSHEPVVFSKSCSSMKGHHRAGYDRAWGCLAAPPIRQHAERTNDPPTATWANALALAHTAAAWLPVRWWWRWWDKPLCQHLPTYMQLASAQATSLCGAHEGWCATGAQ